MCSITVMQGTKGIMCTRSIFMWLFRSATCTRKGTKSAEKPQRKPNTGGMAWDVIIRKAHSCYFHKPIILMAL